MKLKGIVLVVILLLASIMMPFDVYAAVQSQIVPTFSSSTSQWNGHLYVTNFSDGTNNQASSTLSFTFDDDYYGMIYFDGYGPSNQHIANYAVCFVAGGYGEYRYSYYQNGVINITNVTINIVNVVKPQSSVDLTQIITLLTAIENDTSSIDNVLDTTLAQIRLVLAELVESNGYLEKISQFRMWNVPTESFSAIYYMMDKFDIVSMYNENYYQYPIFDVTNGGVLNSLLLASNIPYVYICGINYNVTSSNYTSIFDYDADKFSLSEYQNISLFRYDVGNVRDYGHIFKFTVRNKTNGYLAFDVKLRPNLLGKVWVMPIYFNNKDYKFISTEFALKYGLTNRLLDDLNIIANGTNQSNSAASDLESDNSQMADDMDDLATIESGYNQQFNNQLQSIDFTSPIQSNAGILPAANFVISIFNGLINNNPFSVLIIIVCILLIGKKVIGK